MEMLFTINPRPHNSTNDNTNVESFSSVPNQENEPRQEEIDVFSVTNDVLPPGDDDSDDEVDVDGDDYLLKIEDFLCRILSWFSRPSYPLLDSSLGKFVSMIYIAYS
nr:hypothetical protein [Tanacetum cinerariifolium]